MIESSGKETLDGSNDEKRGDAANCNVSNSIKETSMMTFIAFREKECLLHSLIPTRLLAFD